MEYKKRIVDKILDEKLHYRGAVVIEGAKWCGKTTTAKQHAKSSISMLDRKTYLRYINGAGNLLEGPAPRLIDEWQETPTIWDEIRNEVDNRSAVGQFILTGSATPSDEKEIKHSGTGRFSWIRMRPMSLYESGDSKGSVSLKALFDGQYDVCGESDTGIDRLAYLACRGGWPGALNLEDTYALKHAFDLYDSIVHHDINRVDGIRKDLFKLEDLMRSYARNQGTAASYELLAKDTEGNSRMDSDTVRRYVEALERLFVVENMPAWNPNLRSKTAIRSSVTRYFTDPSLAVAALSCGPDALLNDIETFGFIFENMCIRDLRVYADALDGKVYHFRDKSGLECDAVLSRQDGSYCLIEIKLGESGVEHGAETLLKLKNKIDTRMMKEPSFLMVLTGTSEYPYRRKDGVFVVPLGVLKD